jgi:hypothetical protein
MLSPWMLNDPMLNYFFSRPWDDPPDPEKQRRRPGKETAPCSNQQNQLVISALLRHAARMPRPAVSAA